MPEETKALLNYAVVEDGIITNVLVFDNEDTAEEFGCLPLAPYQGIGDIYVSPEDYAHQMTRSNATSLLNDV